MPYPLQQVVFLFFLGCVCGGGGDEMRQENYCAVFADMYVICLGMKNRAQVLISPNLGIICSYYLMSKIRKAFKHRAFPSSKCLMNIASS
jgi:hypothetical protein